MNELFTRAQFLLDVTMCLRHSNDQHIRHACHQIRGTAFCDLIYSCAEICTAGVSWRQIKAVDRANPEPPPPPPSLQSLPQFTLHFCQCVEKAGWGQAVTHMLIHRIIVTKPRGEDGRLLDSEGKKEKIQHCRSYSVLFIYT